MFLAAGDTSGTLVTDFVQFLAQYGLVGMVLTDILITRKYLVPRWSKDEALKAKDEALVQRDKVLKEKTSDIAELKESLAKLQDVTRDQVLPALVRANQLSADYVQEISRSAPKRPRKRLDEGGETT